MIKQDKIKKIKAREILDSRGNPTVEVDLITDNGLFRSSVPSGASKGKYEAKELRDNTKRYKGKGVLKAVKNINEIIALKMKGMSIGNQGEIDNFLIDLDGTKNKSKLGANAILPVSMAACRAGADLENIPLYEYISKIYKGKQDKIYKLPKACFNVLNGGIHAGNNLDIQEFMIIPWFNNFEKSLQVASEIYYELKKSLRKKFGESAINLGDEGGFAPIINSSKKALDLIMEAINKSGYSNKVKIGIDSAASGFYSNNSYKIENKNLNRNKFINYYLKLINKYPIIFLEDPFEEEDYESWKNMFADRKKVLMIGDDLLCTNTKRMKFAYKKRLCNGMILKLNQIGTVTEGIKAAKLARTFNWKIIVSHRSGETCDDFISDLAVGISSDFIKSGAPARGERIVKYNRLLRIEQGL